MNEFLTAALPWLCTGISLALCAVNYHNNKKAENTDSEEKESDNRLNEGISLGMCIGMCIGLLFGAEYISYGLLVSMVMGMFIKKGK